MSPRSILPALEKSLDEAGVRHAAIIVAPGEASKSYATFAEVCDAIIAARLERGDLVLALGGGVVGDLTGFAAASVRRGMRFVQIPTTPALAGRFLRRRQDRHQFAITARISIGAFHQPSLVLADTDVLRRLPPREFAAGYAEVVKYGLIADPTSSPGSKPLARRLRRRAGPHPRDRDELRIQGRRRRAATNRAGRPRPAQSRPYLRPCAGKARPLRQRAARPWRGRRHRHGLRLPLFGARGLCPPAAAERVEAHLRAVGLPTRIGDIAGWTPDADEIVEAMRQDKKVERGALTFILARGIGDCFIAKNRSSPRPCAPSSKTNCTREPESNARRERRACRSILWIAVAILVFCIVTVGAVFAGSETAMTAASRARMHALEKQGDRRAALVNRLLAAPRPPDRRDAARQHARQYRLLGLHDQRSRGDRRRQAARSTPPAS